MLTVLSMSSLHMVWVDGSLNAAIRAIKQCTLECNRKVFTPPGCELHTDTPMKNHCAV